MSYATVARAVWGASLLLFPGYVIRVAASEPADRASRVVGRMLGVRHLAQALAIAHNGTRTLLLLGRPSMPYTLRVWPDSPP